MATYLHDTASLTALLQAWRQGDGVAFSSLVDQVYERLHEIAAQRLGQAGASVTLSPTELVHEALIGAMPTPMTFRDRNHFFATMSLAIRSILIDHARRRGAEKRGGCQLRVTLDGADAADADSFADLLAIEQSLQQLGALDARSSHVLHLTWFAGLEQEQIADLLGISVPTVKRDLSFARAWLQKSMRDGS